MINPGGGARPRHVHNFHTSRTPWRRSTPTCRSRCRPTSRDAARIADAAIDDGRGVVACGGDGLVCRLAGIAAERDGVLAIVPAGSGNDFARHLEIPRDDPVGRRRAAAARAASSASTCAAPRPPTARARGRRPSRTPASTPRPTAGRTPSTGQAELRCTCSPPFARWRRTDPDASASPSTTTCSKPTRGSSRSGTRGATRAG